MTPIDIMIGGNFVLTILLILLSLFLFAKVSVLNSVVEELIAAKNAQPAQPLGYTPLVKPKGPMKAKDIPPGFG